MANIPLPPKRCAPALGFRGGKKSRLPVAIHAVHAPSASSSTSSSDADLYPEKSSESEPERERSPITPVSRAMSPASSWPCRENHLECPYENCDKSFNRPTRLQEHIRSHQNDRIFKCQAEGCDKDFVRSSHLKRHIRSAHSDVREHVCSWTGCGMAFADAARLKRHQTGHESREKYRCNIDSCGEIFRKQGTLDKHQRMVHDGKDAFTCGESNEDGSICEKGFETEYGLKQHKGRIHGEKSYSCSVCPVSDEDNAPLGLTFNTSDELQAHNAQYHPPICGVCAYAAMTEKDLTNHISQSHSYPENGSAPVFTCPFPECDGKTFTRKYGMSTHIKTVHDNKRDFICSTVNLESLNNVFSWTGSDACGRAFKSKQGLEEHIRTAHLALDNRTVARQKRLGTYDPPGPNKKIKTKGQGTDTTLSKLTGTSYQENPKRNIPCTKRGCDYMFTRQYDLDKHLQTSHGFVADFHDAFNDQYLNSIFDSRIPFDNTNAPDETENEPEIETENEIEFETDGASTYQDPEKAFAVPKNGPFWSIAGYGGGLKTGVTGSHGGNSFGSMDNVRKNDNWRSEMQNLIDNDESSHEIEGTGEEETLDLGDLEPIDPQLL